MSSQYNFLREVANRLLFAHPTDLHNCLVVLPTKRACTFLEHYLVQQRYQCGERCPFIAPVLVTIDQWISTVSGLQIPEHTTLLCHLYGAYDRYLSGNGEMQKQEINKPLLLFDRAQRMLSDFEDIDLSLQDVGQIFRNIRYLSELEDLSYLTEAQKKTIKEFWGTLATHIDTDGESESDLSSFYLHLTEAMIEVYHIFREILISENSGYRGMVYRSVAERYPEDIITRTLSIYGNAISHIYFAGLYALSRAERKILSSLKSYESALSIDFFWETVSTPFREGMDFPDKTIEGNCSLLGGQVIEVNTRTAPRIERVTAPSSVIQPKVIELLIDDILAKDPSAVEELRLAIVLNDERALLPLLNSLHLPNLSVNITMGYPLKVTSVAIWIQRYLDIYQRATVDKQGQLLLPVETLNDWLQSTTTQMLFGATIRPLCEWLTDYFFYVSAQELNEKYFTAGKKKKYKKLLPVLFPELIQGRDLVRQLDSLLETLEVYSQFEIKEREKGLTEEKNAFFQSEWLRLELEYIYRYKQLLLKLLNTIGHITYFDSPSTAILLLKNLISAEKIPFEGEPLKGLQVMGFLETRSLSFDYLIFLDVKEGQLPKKSYNPSLIPNVLRSAYNLPTYRNKDDINGYHFFRLLNGTKGIFFMQDIRTRSLEKNVPSRYIDQLTYLTDIPVVSKEVRLPLPLTESKTIEIEKKSPNILRTLRAFCSKDEGAEALSPSDISTYYSCPLRFYYRKIKRLPEPQEDDRELSPALLGTIVHSTLERLLLPVLQSGSTYNLSVVEALLKQKNGTIKQTLEECYSEHRYKNGDRKGKFTERDHVYVADLLRFVCSALEIDAGVINELNQRGESLRLDAFERRERCQMPLPGGQIVNLKGFIDRLDHVETSDGSISYYRIVDYKTGSVPSFLSLQKKKKTKNDASTIGKIIQLYMYAYIFNSNRVGDTSLNLSVPIVPLLYAIRPKYRATDTALAYWRHEKEPIALFAQNDVINRKLRASTEKVSLPHFATGNTENESVTSAHQMVTGLIEEILNPDIPFVQTSITNNCSYCPYASICGR